MGSKMRTTSSWSRLLLGNSIILSNVRSPVAHSSGFFAAFNCIRKEVTNDFHPSWLPSTLLRLLLRCPSSTLRRTLWRVVFAWMTFVAPFLATRFSSSFQRRNSRMAPSIPSPASQKSAPNMESQFMSTPVSEDFYCLLWRSDFFLLGLPYFLFEIVKCWWNISYILWRNKPYSVFLVWLYGYSFSHFLGKLYSLSYENLKLACFAVALLMQWGYFCFR